MQSNSDQPDIAFVYEYPAPLASIYQRLMVEESAFIKPKLITSAFEALIKYCLILAYQDSYRIKINPSRYDAATIEQLLNIKINNAVKLLTPLLRRFSRSSEQMLEKELFLFIFEEFSENPVERREVAEDLQRLLAFAEKYPARSNINYEAFECESDFQAYLPILRNIWQRAAFLSRLPLLYFHDPMDELEAIEQPREEALAVTELMMGVQAIPQALAAGRLPGGPLGRLAVKSQRSNSILSLHPLIMMVETIELNSPTEDILAVGPHLIIFYDEIRGSDQEKLLRYWQLNITSLIRDNDTPKLTVTSGGIFNQLAGLMKIGRNNPKTRSQIAQQVNKLIAQGNLNAAITEFKKISLAEPDNFAIAARLGELHLHASQHNEARELFLQIAEKCMDDGFVPQAMLMYQRANRLSQDDIESNLKLAHLFAEQGCNDLALQQCENIVEHSVAKNFLAGAIKALELATQVRPRDPVIQRRLADLYLSANNRPQALKSLISVGEELLKQGQTEAAKESYEAVLRIKPYHQLAVAMLGQIYLESGNYEKAIEMLVPSCQSDPANIELLNSLGRAYLNNEQLDLAEEVFTTLFTLDKGCYAQLLELARRYLFIGDLEHTGIIVERCLYTLIARGQEQLAIAILESCLAHDPKHLPTIKRLIDIYLLVRDNQNLCRMLQRLAAESRRVGDYNEAKTALRQLAAIDPANPDYIAQLRLLEGPAKKTIGLRREKK